MPRPLLRHPALPVLLIFGALLVWAGLKFMSDCEEARKFQIAQTNGFQFGGNDWVDWQDTDSGQVVAAYVHPLVASNPLLSDRYIRKGDILKRIDYQDIYKAEVADNIVYHSPPGTVLLFQVERDVGSGFEPEWKNIFIENSFAPRYSFSESPPLWTLFPWVIIVGGFLSLISMLIIFPIIRPSMRENWPLFMVIVISFVVFLVMGARHLNLLVRTEYYQLELEQAFTLLISLFLPIYGGASFFARLRGPFRLAVVVSLLSVVLIGWIGLDLIYHRPFALYADALEKFVLLVFLLHVMALLIVSVLMLWRDRSRLDKTFHILAILYIGPLAVIYLGKVLGWEALPQPSLFTDFLVFGAIMIPLINAAAAQLKFGRVSVVLTSSLQYIFFAALCLLLYFILHETLIYFGLQFKYQAYLELSILIVLVIILRAFYRIYEGRFRRYFVLAQQNKKDQIDKFISLIPQYTSSQKLLTDLCAAMSEYFGAANISLKMNDGEAYGEELELSEEILEAIYTYLDEKGGYWARNKQMALEPLPEEMEKELKLQPFAIANPITVNETAHGMLLLGRKRRGVYNIGDLEIVSRIIQQTQLTLGVLHLLERERILVQKNLEANLTVLRSQINPHFLFNTLNSISALIHEDPDGAEEAVEKLAFIFRYTLKHSDRTFVQLREELSLVWTYLEIEKIRFGERLQLHLDVDPEMEDVEIPALIVQTIIENCIKHGIAKIIGQGHVSIKAFPKDGFMNCVIEDNGPGIDLEKIHTSTGLNNIITRLEKIYEIKNLLYFENTGNGTRVTIKIPLDNEQIQSADR